MASILSLLILFLSCCLRQQEGYAEDACTGDWQKYQAEDIDADAQLTLVIRLAAGSGEDPVEGVSVMIWKVADVLIAYGTISYISLYDAYAFDGMTASESNVIASELANRMSWSGAQDSHTTDRDGEVRFEDLSAGIWLVMQSQTQDMAEYAFDPFLVCVPLAEADDEDERYVWTYTVTAEPKIIRTSADGTSGSIEDEESEESDVTGDEDRDDQDKEDDEDAVKTGDEALVALYLGFLLCAGTAAGVLVVLLSGKGRKKTV